MTINVAPDLEKGLKKGQQQQKEEREKKRRKKGCIFESDEHWIWRHLKSFKANAGKTSERGLDHSDIIMGFSQHVHTIMN